jgi:hypothetical protein
MWKPRRVAHGNYDDGARAGRRLEAKRRTRKGNSKASGRFLRYAVAQPVPDLTRSVGIQLNDRVSLRRKAKAIAWSAPDIAPHPDPAWRSRRAIILRPAALFFTRAPDDCRQRRPYDNGPKPAALLGAGMAHVDRLLSASIDHRPARLWKSLAAARRAPLEVQEVHRIQCRSRSLIRTRHR